MDTRKDLLKTYHASRQKPKEVVTAASLVMDAMYWNGCPAGSFSKVYKNYNYELPSGVVVYGDTDHKMYKFKGPDNTDPETEVYTNNIGTNWVIVGDCT